MNLNSHDSICQQISDLIPAYAMGITDAAETALVEANLGHCPDAAAELAEYGDLVDDLLQPQLLVDPPAILEQRLAAAIAPPPKSPLQLPQRWRWVAALLVLIWMVGGAAYGLRQRDLARQANADLRASQAQTQQLEALLSSQTANQIRLATTSLPDQQPAAMLIWQDNAALLSVQFLPPLEPAQTYQLWLIDEIGALSVGTFDVNEAGSHTQLIRLPAAIQNFQRVGISIEPRGGSPSPTTNPILLGRVVP